MIARVLAACLLVVVLVLLSSVITLCGENDTLRRQLGHRDRTMVPVEKLSACLAAAEQLRDVNDACLAVGHGLRAMCERTDFPVKTASSGKKTW